MGSRLAASFAGFACTMLGCSGGPAAGAGDASSSEAGGDATVWDAAGRDSQTVLDAGVQDGEADDAYPGAEAAADASVPDGDRGITADGSCFLPPAPGMTRPSWAQGACPDAGCPDGTACVHSQGEIGYDYGCAPIPAGCGSVPSCACMGCVCELGCSTFDPPGQLTCFNGTISRRAFKEDIVYVDDAEREALARQALEIQLARYRYKGEPDDARRRLGFIIDDQPDPSPAVRSDRTHVDEYGYTSMLLATVQEQARELRALEARIDALENRAVTPARCSAAPSAR